MMPSLCRIQSDWGTYIVAFIPGTRIIAHFMQLHTVIWQMSPRETEECFGENCKYLSHSNVCVVWMWILSVCVFGVGYDEKHCRKAFRWRWRLSDSRSCKGSPTIDFDNNHFGFFLQECAINAARKWWAKAVAVLPWKWSTIFNVSPVTFVVSTIW